MSSVPASLRAEPDAVIGEKYKVARLLGEGGMGAVYEAENSWTRRRVAVKLMRPEFARDPEAVQRFLREAQSAAQIDHPNVVSVLDMGRDAATGSLYIVQEFLVGQDLSDYLGEHGAVSPDESLELILPVIDGLATAHSLGVVHRDLKPENIFLVRGRGGRVVPKIIDFGIAKALRPRENEFRTMIGQAMGTPAYMSPEQARGELDLDARTDVWAIGVVLFQLLSGQLPFEYDENPQVMLAHVITQEPKSLDAVAPSVPSDLRAVVNLALTRDRARRLPDMPTFYAALTATSVGSRARDTLRRNGPVELPAGATPPQSSAPPAPQSAPPQPATPQPATPQPAHVAQTTPDPMRAPHHDPGTFLSEANTLVNAAVVATPMTPVSSEIAPRPSRAPKIIAAVIALVVITIAALALTSSSSRTQPEPVATAQPTPVASPPVAQPPAAQPPVAQPPAAQPPAAQPPVAQPPVAAQPPAVDPARERPTVRHTRGAAERGANGAAIIE
ncbi:MAG: serine/threonine-protein kinase [Polyangiales bacterium]